MREGPGRRWTRDRQVIRWLTENILGFFEEAFAERVDVDVAHFAEFLELGFLGGVEVAGNLDDDFDVEIAVTVALETFNPFPFEAEDGVGLGAGGDADLGLAGEGGHFDFRAEGRLDELDGDLADEIVAITMKDFVSFDVENDVKIAGGAPTETGFAVADGTEARAGVDAGGDFQFNLAGFFATTGTVANAARFFDDLAGAFAATAGLGDAEDAA